MWVSPIPAILAGVSCFWELIHNLTALTADAGLSTRERAMNKADKFLANNCKENHLDILLK